MKKSERPKVVLVNRCLVKNDKSDKLLLIQRSKDDSYNSGMWEFPGGKLDIGQDLSHALEREVMEETGILIEPSSRLVFADSYVIGAGPYSGLTYVVLFGVATAIGGNLKLSNEHDSYVWETYEKALDYELTSESRKALIIMSTAKL
jgi:8-oxo-dGTP pyrophosphatase MutT (NUDIX family)